MKTMLITVMMFFGYVTAHNKYLDWGGIWVIQRTLHPDVECFTSLCTEIDEKQEEYRCELNYKHLNEDKKLVWGHENIFVKVDKDHDNKFIIYNDGSFETEAGGIATAEFIESDGLLIKKFVIEYKSTGGKIIYCKTKKAKLSDAERKAVEKACNEEGTGNVNNDCEELANFDD